MNFLLALSRAIDALNRRVGHAVYWLILAAVLVSAGNAMSRYLFDISSNAWLELQWYLFSAVFLLAAGYALLHNEHVRIDVIFGHLPPRLRAWIDLIGGVFFLLPMAIIIMALSWPMFVDSYRLNEYSSDAGGLLRWPVKLLIPVGFLLLALQGVSEIIKRIAFLLGHIPDPLEKHHEPVAEEQMQGLAVVSAFLVANMAPLMFAALVVFLLLGYPVAFALAANGLFFGLLAIDLGLLGPQLFQALPERVFGIMRNDTLLAIPFFTFMGLILERSGMAEDLLETIGQMFGPVRGGLAYAVVFVGALLAATTGVVAASVISMGLISLPIMLRYGYDRPLAAGVIAASGTLAQIIPPSLVLIVMADQLGRSVGDMYQGAFIPGLMLAGAVRACMSSRRRWSSREAAPALPPDALNLREDNGRAGYLSLLVVVALTVAAA